MVSMHKMDWGIYEKNKKVAKDIVFAYNTFKEYIAPVVVLVDVVTLVTFVIPPREILVPSSVILLFPKVFTLVNFGI